MVGIDDSDHRLEVQRGFSLIEAVIALGIFAFAMTIILGAFSQSVARNREILEFHAVERVIAQTPAALAMLGWDANLNPDGQLGLVERTESGPLLLVADRHGDRVRPLDRTEGLLSGEQFFLVSLVREESPGYRYGTDIHGAIVFLGEVSWPFRIPSADGYREIELNQRRHYNFSISARP